MAINLYMHNMSEATLVRQPISKQNVRLNLDKVKANWEQLKSESKPMVEISPEAVAKLKTTGSVRQNGCNYSLDAFFQKDMPKITTDGGYVVEGVSFTKEELEKCRMVMKTAVEGISSGVGNLDYENYARMGIAVNSVQSYADANFSEEQAEVINRAMNEYNDALIKAEQDIMSDGTYIDSDFGAVSDYYGKAHVLSEGELKALNDLKEELAEITGRTYKKSESGLAVLVQSATNTKLTTEIKDMFAGVDMSDKDALNKAFAKYKELMKPVYTAYGMNDNRGGLTKVLNQDVESFSDQISNILAAANYHAVDSMV